MSGSGREVHQQHFWQEAALNQHAVLCTTQLPQKPTSASSVSGKEPAGQGRRRRCRFDPWVRKIPWRSKWQSTPVFLLRESQGQRSPVGYSLWDHKDLDTTERLSIAPSGWTGVLVEQWEIGKLKKHQTALWKRRPIWFSRNTRKWLGRNGSHKLTLTWQ